MPHTASLDPTLTFDFDEQLDDESDIGDAKHHPDNNYLHTEVMLDVNVNKALPARPSTVVTSLTANEDDRSRDHDHDHDHDVNVDSEQDASRSSRMSTSSASSVAGSPRRVSEATRDVGLSETEIRVIESRVQRLA